MTEIGLLLLLAIPGAILVTVIWLAVVGHSGRCNHMFPERGIGCSVCDEWYWHSDEEALHKLDDRLARIEEHVFPLEPSDRIWIKQDAPTTPSQGVTHDPQG